MELYQRLSALSLKKQKTKQKQQQNNNKQKTVYQDTRYKIQDDFIVFSCIQLYTYKTRMIFGH